MTRSTQPRFRQRKLSTKQTSRSYVRTRSKRPTTMHSEIYQRLRRASRRARRSEHHLQAAISASQAAAIGGKVAQIYIPTPDAIASSIQYDRLYPLRFSQPATYIRFSSTVEDCSGCPYCMTSEDEAFLKSLNAGRPASSQCSEDQFEEVMNFFEQTSHSKQPYASIDNTAVLSYDDMVTAFDDTLPDDARAFAKDIYEHWKSQRLKRGNRSLTPELKSETGQDTDDADPYVCFRRREVRQVRKTRGRDAQSTEKLKKLRKELEDARQLVAMVKQREMTRREVLAVDRQIFEQRMKVKGTKRKLGIKGDDEDLITQKPQKKKALEPTQGQRPSTTQLRLPGRPEGRPPEADLVLLQDTLAEKENEIKREIENKITQHKMWNKGYTDMTLAPLTPPPEDEFSTGFRTAITQYLPTPPGSASSGSPMDALQATASPSHGRENVVPVRYSSPSFDGPLACQPSFRRRIGRGGRMMIDRRGWRLLSTEGIDDMVLDRYKFDQDDEDDPQIYRIDPYNPLSMRYRASIFAQNRDAAHHAAQAQAVRRSQLDSAIAQATPQAGSS